MPTLSLSTPQEVTEQGPGLGVSRPESASHISGERAHRPPFKYRRVFRTRHSQNRFFSPSMPFHSIVRAMYNLPKQLLPIQGWPTWQSGEKNISKVFWLFNLNLPMFWYALLFYIWRPVNALPASLWPL